MWLSGFCEHIASLFESKHSYITLFKFSNVSSEAMAWLGRCAFVVPSDFDNKPMMTILTYNILTHGEQVPVDDNCGRRFAVGKFAEVRNFAKAVAGSVSCLEEFEGVRQINPNILMLTECVSGKPVQDKVAAFIDGRGLPNVPSESPYLAVRFRVAADTELSVLFESRAEITLGDEDENQVTIAVGREGDKYSINAVSYLVGDCRVLYKLTKPGQELEGTESLASAVLGTDLQTVSAVSHLFRK